MSYYVKDLKHAYNGTPVLNGLSFEVRLGEFFAVLGPSGCGKTTLLSVLSGLLPLQAGTVGEGFKNDIGFVFQEPRLLPQRTVMENLKLINQWGESEKEFEARALRYLEEVKLAGYDNHYPDELSGGMQQRVSMVRAFLSPTPLLFLDEPFKSLDVETMLTVIEAFNVLQSHTKKTVIMITHDVLAASLMADRLMVLSDKPTTVRQILDNPLLPHERRVDHEVLGAFQSKVYGVLLNATDK